MASLTLTNPNSSKNSMYSGVTYSTGMNPYVQAYWNTQSSKPYSNLYTKQNPVTSPDSDLVAFPYDPTGDEEFIENYRKTTKELGGYARALKTAGKDRPNVSEETQAIMDRIKLPTYNDVLSDKQRKAYTEEYSADPEKAERDFQNAYSEWEDDNFYYKLRAAKVLQRLSESERNSVLNLFDLDAYYAKNYLDQYVKSADEDLTNGIIGLGKVASNWINSLAEKMKDSYLRSTGQRTTETDKNGVTTTTTITSGDGSIDDFADSLGENNSFRMYSKSDYDENGNLTEEAKSRGPSAWNSETTNPDGSSTTEVQNENATSDNATTGDSTTPAKTDETTDEVVEYTYQPGDTFGQVILNLGLQSGNGLWGEDGDVEFYTKQLMEQGIWPEGERGNIPIGTTIKLRRRK